MSLLDPHRNSPRNGCSDPHCDLEAANAGASFSGGTSCLGFLHRGMYNRERQAG